MTEREADEQLDLLDYLAPPPPEDTGVRRPDAEPWDATKIRIDTKAFSIREVMLQIDDKELDLSPDFQRAFVWKPSAQVRLIESILLGIPLPSFYFNQEPLRAATTEARLQVVDGVQRLNAIRAFVKDELLLDLANLEYLRHLKGASFSTLDVGLQRRFVKTQLVVHVIGPETPDAVKYDIFKRINTGGNPLSSQEIRHAVTKTRSREFLKSLVELESFAKATNGYFLTKDGLIPASTGEQPPDKRMMDRELALRFCAFSATPTEEYRESENLDTFLLAFSRKLDDQTRPVDLDALRVSFDAAMQKAFLVFGGKAFRKATGPKRTSQLNRALFEAQAVALATVPLELVEEKSSAIREKFSKLIEDANFVAAISAGTGDFSRVETRLSLARAAVAEAIV